MLDRLLRQSPIDSEFQTSVKIDKLQLLYRQSSHAVLGSLIAGVIWAAIIWQHPQEASRSAVSIWLLALALASGARLTLFLTYRRMKPEGAAVLRWQLPYVVTLVVSSVIWGLGCVLVVPPDSRLLLVVTYVFIVGLAGAALSGYGVYLWLSLLIIVIVMTPIVVVLLSTGEAMTILLAIAGLWFFITSMRGLSIHNKTVDESFRLAHELRRATQIAQWQAQMDGLTGLKNRSAFIDAADAVIKVIVRDRQAATMLVIDIDSFKEINDTHGHAAGDTALVCVAEVFRTTLRQSDLCGRLGGDEFAILLPNTSLEAARIVAEKLRATVENEPIVFSGASIPITLSVGIAAGQADAESLIGQADGAMYQAKRRGKNQIAERLSLDAEVTQQTVD
jgi:diguanylate cyclase